MLTTKVFVPLMFFLFVTFVVKSPQQLINPRNMISQGFINNGGIDNNYSPKL